MVEKAVATSEFGSEAAFDFPEKIKSTGKEKINIYDIKVVDKSIEEIIKIGEDIGHYYSKG